MPLVRMESDSWDNKVATSRARCWGSSEPSSHSDAIQVLTELKHSN